jgi:uncharacterized protein
MLYVDTSAFIKLLAAEEHSEVLRSRLAGTDLWSSKLLDVEAHRAARRSGIDRAIVEARLRPVTLVAPAETTFVAARTVGSDSLRSLDALHLATALELGADLDGVATYDRRMAVDCAGLGIAVVSPGLEPGWWTVGR